MGLSRTIFRRMILPAVTGMGIERLLWKSAGRKRIILCYHGATREPDFKVNGRHIATEQLAEHFRYFKKHFDVCPVAEFFDRHDHQPSRPQIALTFDDGFRNNFTEVLPLMQQYDVPASFYITTNCLDDPDFLNWSDMMEIVMATRTDNVFEFNGVQFHRGNGMRNTAGQTLFDYVKSLGEERDEMLRLFAAKYDYLQLRKNVPEDYYKMVSKEDLAAFASSPLVEIGSHTMRHYNLSNISPALAEKELRESRIKLERVLGRTVDSIAYPDGSYNDVVKEISRRAGYTKLLAVTYKCDSDQQDRNVLPRFTISNTTTFSSNMIRMSRQARYLAF